MEPEKIERINELSRFSRERELTQAEKEEQNSLRQEYISGFRENMRQVLDSIRVQKADGTLRSLQKKTDNR